MLPAPDGNGKKYYVQAGSSFSRSVTMLSVSSPSSIKPVSITDTISAARLCQQSQRAPFIILRVTLPADKAGLFQPFQQLTERAGVRANAGTHLKDRQAIFIPQYQHDQVLLIG